jgi:threonine dehydrogenase-like Zn-dependent dehydrogenase
VPPAPGRAWDIKRVIDTFFRLMVRGDIALSDLISHRIPFREAATAFRLIDEHPELVSKVILEFGSAE